MVMANKIPLSVSQQSKKKFKREDGDSYEQKVKNKSFEDNTPKFNFGMGYRGLPHSVPRSVKRTPDVSSLGRDVEKSLVF